MNLPLLASRWTLGDENKTIGYSLAVRSAEWSMRRVGGAVVGMNWGFFFWGGNGGSWADRYWNGMGWIGLGGK